MTITTGALEGQPEETPAAMAEPLAYLDPEAVLALRLRFRDMTLGEIAEEVGCSEDQLVAAIRRGVDECMKPVGD